MWHLTTLVDNDDNAAKSAFKQQLKDQKFWTPPEDAPNTLSVTIRTGDKLVLEHYFECRFAGPLIMVCTGELSFNDDSVYDAMFLLDRVMNHPRNLAWTDVELNQIKNAYFGGNAIFPYLRSDPSLNCIQ